MLTELSDSITRGKLLMRTIARLSAGLLAAAALTVGFMPGASAAEPTGITQFTTLCVGGCVQ
ncbi:hypothetical protein HY68_35625 [Streptomyces sp. AcH 505]|nr:hypothetical protein HY68_35625 [Streptomyces sp. AcH 505]